MTIDELTTMLKPYGYTCHTELTPVQAGMRMGIVPVVSIDARGRSLELCWLDMLPSYTHERVITWLDTHYGNGQHHMHCTCGIPVLQSVEGSVTCFYVYRLASHGPDSEMIRYCPECRQEVANSVREIAK